MLAEERRFRIREILATQRTISASELCSVLEVTPATIRRDLAALEQEGVLVRSHGGAVSRMSSTKFQPSYEILARSKVGIASAASTSMMPMTINSSMSEKPRFPRRGFPLMQHRILKAALAPKEKVPKKVCFVISPK